jgi:hypothetical protein
MDFLYGRFLHGEGAGIGYKTAFGKEISESSYRGITENFMTDTSYFISTSKLP